MQKIKLRQICIDMIKCKHHNSKYCLIDRTDLNCTPVISGEPLNRKNCPHYIKFNKICDLLEKLGKL